MMIMTKQTFKLQMLKQTQINFCRVSFEVRYAANSGVIFLFLVSGLTAVWWLTI